jgi:hypothetical protein
MRNQSLIVCLFLVTAKCLTATAIQTEPRVLLMMLLPAPQARGWAVRAAVLEVELLASKDTHVLTPRIEYSADISCKSMVSPDHRRCRLVVTANRLPRQSMADSRHLTIVFPFESNGRSGELVKTTPVYVYQTGAISVGGRPLASARQVPPNISGGVKLFVPVVVNREALVILEAERDDTIASAFGHVFHLRARSSNLREVRLLRCSGIAASRGFRIEQYSSATPVEGRVIHLLITPARTDGSMKEGRTDLRLTFEVQRGSTRQLVTTLASIIVARDGTSRVATLRNKSPDLSPPRRHQAHDGSGPWVQISADQGSR